MFASIADQLWGDEKLHPRLRKETADFLEENKETYKFFIEDDENIDDYIAWIRKNGRWASQMEMNVLAQLYRFNVVVHQVDNPSMAQGFHDWNDPNIPTLHLSFHLGCHYNSVRSLKDDLSGSALDVPVGHKLSKLSPKELDKLPKNNTESTTSLLKASPSKADLDVEYDADLLFYACRLVSVTNIDRMKTVFQAIFGDEMIDSSVIDASSELIAEQYAEILMDNLVQGFSGMGVNDENDLKEEKDQVLGGSSNGKS